MKVNKAMFAIALVSVALSAAFWAVYAQERPMTWAPPTVLQPDAKDADKSTAKYPHQTKPLAKKKGADPTLIIPPEVYEAPRPLTLPVEIKPELLQVGGQLPPPAFPPLPSEVKDPAPPLPSVEPAPVLPPPAAPVLPPPVPEPAKVLIVEPPAKIEPKKSPAVEANPGVLVLPQPAPVLPPPRTDSVVSPPLTVTVNDPPAARETIKSFVRIRSAQAEMPAPVLPARNVVIELPPGALGPIPLSPGPTTSGALVNLQTPLVIVEKRGPASLRAGETQLYQLVIRNAGNVVAQQIRIEDDIPADMRLLNAEPAPQMQGGRASWMLANLPAGAEQSLRLTLKADANVQVTCNTSVHVAAGGTTTRAANAPSNLSIRLTGPERVGVGKPAVFEIHLANPLRQPLTGIVLYGDLPDGLTTPAGNRIEGEVNGAIAPGEFKILKMPTTALKPGRHTVHARVVTQQGEAAATTTIEIHGDAFTVQPAPLTRLVPGRDGDLRIELANHTGKPLRNVQISTLLPEGLVFVGASDRGLYQSNSRTVHWLIDQVSADALKTIIVRVNGDKAGQLQSVVSARAEGIAEIRASGAIVLEGIAELTLRVNNRDNQLEVGRETVYEIVVQNPGSAEAHNVQVQVQLPPGLTPRNAQGGTRFSLERQSVVFEPIPVLAPQGQTIFRVMAVAQTAGADQRVRCSVASEEQRSPIQREVSVLIYNGN